MNRFSEWFNVLTKIASTNIIVTVLHVVAIMVAIATGNVFLLIIASVVTIANLLNFKSNILQSIVSRLFLSTILVLCLYQCEAVLFWAIDIWVNHTVYAVLTYILSMIALTLSYFRHSSRHAVRSTQNKGFIIGLLVLLPALLTGSLYFARTIAPQDTLESTVIKSVNFAMDDASHVSIFSDMLQSDGNLLAGAERKSQLTRAAYATYPSGWHASTAIVTNSVIGYNPNRTVGETIQIYFYVKLATLLLLIVALTIFVLIICAKFKLNYKSIPVYVSVLALIAYISFLIIMPMFFDGFFSYLPVMIYALVFAYISILKNLTPSLKYFILLILAAASTITWAITGIILFMAIAFQIVSDHKKLSRVPKWLYGLSSVFTLLALIPIYILVDGDKTAVSNITAAGGIVSPSHLLLLALIGIFIYMLQFKDKDNVAKLLMGLIVAHLLVLAGVLCYLTLDSPSIGYYYYKIQVIPTLILLVLAGVLLIKYINSITIEGQFKSVIGPILVVTMLALSIPTLFSYEYFQTLVSRSRSFPLLDSDVNAMKASFLDEKHTDNNERVFFYFPGSAARSIIGSNTSRLSYTASRCDVRVFSAIYTSDSKAIGKAIENCAPDSPTIIMYTDSDGALNIKNSIDSSLLESKEVILRVQ